MPTTTDGTEFYLLELDSADPLVGITQLEAATRGVVRDGDGVMVVGGRIFVAVVGKVYGSAKVARRLVRLIRERGIEAKITLVPDPLPHWASTVTQTIGERGVVLHLRGDNA